MSQRKGINWNLTIVRIFQDKGFRRTLQTIAGEMGSNFSNNIFRVNSIGCDNSVLGIDE